MKGDFRVTSTTGGEPTAHKYQVQAGAVTTIKAGEWVIQGTGDDVEYVTIAADGAANTAIWIGVAATDSTDTVAADGEVYVFDDPNYIFTGKATTFTNLATTSILTEVTLDVDGSTTAQTIDENDTTTGTLRIMSYDSELEEVHVKMAHADHLFGK